MVNADGRYGRWAARRMLEARSALLALVMIVNGCSEGTSSTQSDNDVNPAQSGDAVITGIVFDWATHMVHAPGSDNFPLTWDEDGHQYTSWGDGGGFNGTNSRCRVSLGFARLEGNYPSFQPVDVWGDDTAACAAQRATLDGKVESILSIDGILYALRSPASGEGGFAWKEVMKSTDKARSWSIVRGSRLEGRSRGEPALAFYIQYGRNYSANTDGYVYIYTIRIQNPDDWNVQKPGVTWLARAPVADEAFVLPANWEWFTGLNGSAPTWGQKRDRAPVIEDEDGYMRGSAIYLPAFRRYVMVQNHTARNQGNIVIYAAPEPWGPWNPVIKKTGWPDGNAAARQFAFGSFSPKWLEPDGRCVFVWFRPDRWNSVRCRFLAD